MKKKVRLTESQLRKIVTESTLRCLREFHEDNGAPYYLYVNYECVGEYEDYEEAEREAQIYLEEDPEAVVDINDCTDENSVFGVN